MRSCCIIQGAQPGALRQPRGVGWGRREVQEGGNICILMADSRCCIAGTKHCNMPGNLENSAVATGLEKICFHSNPKERQHQRMFKLPHNCTHLTRWQSNAPNSPSQASTVPEPWNSRCSSWISKRQRNQRSNCQHPLDHQKSKRVQQKHLFLLYWIGQILWLCGSQQTVENSSRDENTRLPDLPPEKPVCRSRHNR